MQKLQKKILDRFQHLVERGEALLKKCNEIEGIYSGEYPSYVVKDFTAWKLNSFNALEKMSLENFSDKFEEINNTYADRPSASLVSELLGVIVGADDEVKFGFLNQIETTLHTNFFDSITEQVKALLKNGHKIPAAVLARIVIEKWIKDIANENNIDFDESEKASSINTKLKSHNVITTPRWRVTQSHLDVGNLAAHGKEDDFEEQDVKNMITFIETVCI